MKPVYIVANWKSNKIEKDALLWLDDVIELSTIDLSEKTIILAPSFTLLPFLRKEIDQRKLPISLCSQNVSPFAQGPYTGEVCAQQVKDFAHYVLIGHSERRTSFAEGQELLVSKVKRSQEEGLNVIFCVQDQNTIVPEGVKLIAYEPTFAIGTGITDTPDNADSVAKIIAQKESRLVLYGGSVTAQTVNAFTQKENISGVLVGGASLQGKEFVEIIKNA